MRDLNQLYTTQSALFFNDSSYQSFEWIDFHDSDNSVVSFMRRNLEREEDTLIFVCNFTPIPRHGYRIGAPLPGYYDQLLNSDDLKYGGSGVGMNGGLTADELPWQGLQYSLNLTLPPLGVVILKPRSAE